MTSGEKKQYFGNKLVDKHRKEELVGEVFDSVADNYDLMNDLMSFGLHRKWKDELVEYVLFPDKKILDVASGTGDIAGKIMQKAKELHRTPDITITDINENMLENCKHKLGAGSSDNASYFNFITSNAEKLPVSDNSFDYYTIAFGIRNVADIKAALREAYRVLKPYGKFLCLEFSKVDNSLLRKIYNLYSYNAIPLLGEKVAGDRASYEYLVESIRRFPDGEEFAEMIKQAGFSQVRIKTLTFGITAIHTAYKI